MTLTKDDVIGKGYNIRVLTSDKSPAMVRALLYLDERLKWCMACSDCGSAYWYNVRTDATVTGSYKNRSAGVATIGYPVASLTLYRFGSCNGDYVKVDSKDGNAVLLAVQDLVYFFGDVMDAVRNECVFPDDYAVNSWMVTDTHVRVFENRDMFLPADAMRVVEDVSATLWNAVHHGIPGLSSAV